MSLSPVRFLAWIALPVAVLVVLGLWARREVRAQAGEVGQALIAQGEVLAQALGLALASAAASARELDELLAWKLLDNARLLALVPPGVLADERELAAILEANGLDAVLWFSPDGKLRRSVGVEVSGSALQAGIDELLQSGADELVLGSVGGVRSEIIASAVALPGGGALATMSDTGRAFARGRRLVDPRRVRRRRPVAGGESSDAG
ncbi:MAG: hypothetical protein O7A04_07010 [Acidobacteria bacterium]|nr:hypothetical protein [Acidobacteriota bacterium]